MDICDVGIYNSRGERISNTAANSKGIFLVTKWSALPANSGNKVYLKFHYKIWILDDEPYTIRILGNQEGVMSYTVTKYNASGAKTADYPFKSISVEEGKTITGRISGASASVQGATLLGMTDYDITLPDGTVIEPLEELTGDELDNITITVTEDGGGYAVGGGAYTKGEIVSLYALADTGEFLGWYEDDILISDSEELYFTCDGNRTIEARFTGQNAERPYYTTVADAAEALRDGIKNCLSPIAIEYRSESDNPSVVGEIWEKAVAHTGVSDEGDYLNYQRASFGMEYAPSYENGVYIYEISYDLAYYTNGAQESEMDLVTDDLVSSLITDEMSDYEKIQAVYRYVCENVFYDYRAEDSEIKQYTAYAALMDKTAVCQGYANLFYRMALSAGIDCRIVSGIAASSEEAHAWNIVKLDGVYYNVDATWDSSVVASDDDFQFFLRGSYNFDKLHIRGEAYKTQDFLEKYPVSETDYIEVPIEANEPIDCEDFFVQLSDGSVLTLADYESHKFMLIYGDSECGNMMAFVSFLEENYQQLEQADLPVIVSMDDTMEDILAYAANYPHLIFGQRMNCDFGCSNMLEILEPNFEGWYIMPAVFLINGNRECVYHSTGYVTESKDLIQKLDQLTSIQSDGRSYSIGEHHECVDFTYTLIDGATISKQDYIGTRTIFAYGEAGNGRSYLSAFLDILKCYTPLLAEKGIQVVTVLLDAQTNPGGWQAFCSQYPDFLCVEADNYAWSMWEALQLYDPAVETVSFPVVFMLHPDGEYVYLSSGLPKNIYDVLDWFSIVSDLEAQSVATIINALKRDGNIVVAEVICSDINASVFCGAYNNSGKMIAARSAQITSESNYQFQFDGQQFDYAKAFIVDGNFRPLCESKKS